MSSDSSRSLRTAWLVVVLLLPVALLNYLDRQMLAAMKASVIGQYSEHRQRLELGTDARAV